MRILVLNTGSSSVKYKLFQAQPQVSELAAGLIERVGQPGYPIANYEQALVRIFDTLRDKGLLSAANPLAAIGHRVVHGGEDFREPVVLDANVSLRLRELDSLAPLHNPVARAGIEAAQRLDPSLPQVLVFDTAFFHALSPPAYRYALPKWCYEELAVRRYGFHGTSHQYVSRQAAALLERPADDLRLITLHLGNGASVSAVRGGRAIDTSMGLTPLEGLVMGTRCGDIDPSIVTFLQQRTGKSAAEVEQILIRESGLRGMCGETDMREVLRRRSEGDPDAVLAIEIYVRRILKYVGSYYVLLGGLDALVFTAGVGEHSPEIRRRVCQPLAHLGIDLDERRNTEPQSHAGRITTDDSPTTALVVPTDEERAIAELVLQTLE